MARITANDILQHLRKVQRRNVETLRRDPLAEISGALGDLGTLLPLMIAMAIQHSIHLDSTLVFSGFWNVATGAVFGIPLPVQPMKAIAARAIATNADIRTVSLAGAWVSVAVLVLSVTGLLQWATRKIPVPIVKGIQLGAGLSLIIKAGSSLLGPLHWIRPATDNKLWAFFAFVALIASQRYPKFPYALHMFVVSLILAAIYISIRHEDDDPYRLHWFHIWQPHVHVPNFGSLQSISMAVGQLPLTTLNSIIATSALAEDLLPDVHTPSVTSLGISVAAMNLSSFLFGAMPMCHGSGGLAAQFRFGGRSGASVILLGLFKIVLGLFFGSSLLELLRHYPRSILGIMVIAAGLELAKVGQSLNYGAADLWDGSVHEGEGGLMERIRRHRNVSDEERTERWTVMLMTTAGILAFQNDAVGFLAGVLCWAAYRLAERFDEWYARRRNVLHRERTPLLSGR